MHSYVGYIEGPKGTRTVEVKDTGIRAAYAKVSLLTDEGEHVRGVQPAEPKLAIRFWSSTSLPMYGHTVEELHLDIDGLHYVVAPDDKGKPKLKLYTQ